MKIAFKLVNKTTGKEFVNGHTGKVMEFTHDEQAQHYLHCFGDVTFGSENNEYIVEIIGEILSVNDFCKGVMKNKRNIDELANYREYLIHFKKKYSIVHLEYMVEFLNDAIRTEQNRLRDKNERRMNGFFGGLFGK